MPAMMMCPYCAKEIRTGALICRYCREDLSSPSVFKQRVPLGDGSTPDDPPASEHRQSAGSVPGISEISHNARTIGTWRTIRLVALSLLGLVGAVFAAKEVSSSFGGLRLTGPSGALVNAYMAANEGRYVAATARLSQVLKNRIVNWNNLIERDSLKPSWDGVTRGRTIRRITIDHEVQAPDGSVRVYFRAYFTNGAQEDDDKYLVKKSGVWKITLAPNDLGRIGVYDPADR